MAFAAQRAGSPLGPFNFERRDPGPHVIPEIAIEVFCDVDC